MSENNIYEKSPFSICGYLAYYNEKGIILNIYFVLMVVSMLICGLYGMSVSSLSTSLLGIGSP